MWRYMLALLLIGCTSSAVAAVWTEDFSGDLSKWTITTAGSGTMSIVSGTLSMSSPYGANRAEARPNDPFFDLWIQTDPYTVELDFMVPNTSHHWFFVYADSRVHTVIDYPLDSSSTLFRYRGGPPAGNYTIATLSTNQWYTMRYEVTPSAGTYDIYVDGVKKVTGAAFLNENWGPFTIGDRTTSPSNDYGYASWDNFRITASVVPEPCSLATWLGLGGIGFAMYAWRRRKGARLR